MNYSITAKTFLEKNNPKELNDLKKRGKLQTFLRDAEELYSRQEQTIIEQMTKDDDQNQGTLEKARKLNSAKMVAREQSMADMGEFLNNL